MGREERLSTLISPSGHVGLFLLSVRRSILPLCGFSIWMGEVDASVRQISAASRAAHERQDVVSGAAVLGRFPHSSLSGVESVDVGRL